MAEAVRSGGPIAPRDSVLDSLALVETYLRGDWEGFVAIREHCDPRPTVHALAAMLAGGFQRSTAAETGIPVPADDEPAGDEVFAVIARLREDIAGQYDRAEHRGD